MFIEDNADSTLFSEASANEPQKETNIRKRLKVKDITAKRSVLKILKSETTRTCRVPIKFIIARENINLVLCRFVGLRFQDSLISEGIH